MNDPQPISPRARLQTLLAIPERQRTDAEWDEINELEIMLHAAKAQGQLPSHHNPGNRQQQPMHGGGHHRQGGGGGPGGHGQKQRRKFHQRPPKRGPR